MISTQTQCYKHVTVFQAFGSDTDFEQLFQNYFLKDEIN